jgi:hypothetical protein
MKTATAALIGIMTIALVFFGFGIRGNSGSAVQAQPAAVGTMPAQAMNAQGMNAQAVPVNAVQGDGGWQAAPAAPAATLVNCGPGSQTLVRSVWVNGQPVSQVDCVAGAATGFVAAQQAVPVSYQVPVYDAQMARPRAYQPGPVRRSVARSQRSWKKTALVIGGTTAAGAGLGGLIGGKKGALIGAALGGGAGTIYEATRR